MKSAYEIRITVAPEGVEAVETVFNISGAVGTATDGLKRKAGEPLSVIGYFETHHPDLKVVKDMVDEALLLRGLQCDLVKGMVSGIVQETDWLAEWKRHWKPTVTAKFVIAPPWAGVDEQDKIVIRIEPNMAFGTGTHETTQLCLQAIAENYRAGQSFLDVGTGTGILAIAVAKLATQKDEKPKILAIDSDKDSVKIAKENAAANGVDDRIEFIHGTVTDDVPIFDLVCANLTLDVIQPLLPLLIAKTNEILVLSGILTEQKDLIEGELRKFEISNFKFEIAGEWLAVIISKV